MRADSAVEPTRSEKITVTWRRSARSSGGGVGVPERVAASTEIVLATASLRRATMASSRTCLVYLIFAECRLVFPKAQASQPHHDVHWGAADNGVTHIMFRCEQGV